MRDTETIIANMKRRSAEIIVEEIQRTGISKCFNNARCIEKVKNELGIDLKECEQGYLVFA